MIAADLGKEVNVIIIIDINIAPSQKLITSTQYEVRILTLSTDKFKVCLNQLKHYLTSECLTLAKKFLNFSLFFSNFIFT